MEGAISALIDFMKKDKVTYGHTSIRSFIQTRNDVQRHKELFEALDSIGFRAVEDVRESPPVVRKVYRLRKEIDEDLQLRLF